MTEHVLSREEILSAIREMTAAIGRPPGRRTFVARYRVPASAFGGMYWARWSDAVRDAGLVPLTPPGEIREDFILEALAKLTRRLGRYPTQGEMRVLKLTEPEFPGVPAVVKRLGTRPEQTQRVAAWARDSPEYEDVAQLLGENIVDPDPNVEADPNSTVSGYVYLFRQEGFFYKIGLTTNVPRRWAEIQGAAATRVDLLHYVRTDDMYGIERYWHMRFALRRRGGEWFDLSPTDVAAFRRRKNFM